ncbi:MAG: DUF421 domain-containing protein [Coprobacillaceae bacterium]
MYDYIIGITFGSIAAEFVADGMEGFTRAMIGMIVYTIFTIFLSKLAQKSPPARKVIDGQPVILYENDCLYNKELKKAKMDIDEFLMECRIGGYFNLYDLELVVLETNGTLSFLPKEKNRPTQVNDLDVKIQDVKIPMILIKEGKVLEENLKKINKDTSWLHSTLNNQGGKTKRSFINVSRR